MPEKKNKKTKTKKKIKISQRPNKNTPTIPNKPLQLSANNHITFTCVFFKKESREKDDKIHSMYLFHLAFVDF
jgi:hypothetical protein